MKICIYISNREEKMREEKRKIASRNEMKRREEKRKLISKI